MGPRRSGYGKQGKPGGSDNSGMAQEKGGPPSSQFSKESISNDIGHFSVNWFERSGCAALGRCSGT